MHEQDIVVLEPVRELAGFFLLERDGLIGVDFFQYGIIRRLAGELGADVLEGAVEIATDDGEVPETRVHSVAVEENMVRVDVLRPGIQPAVGAVLVVVGFVGDGKTADAEFAEPLHVKLRHDILVAVGLQCLRDDFAVLLLVAVDGVADRLVLLLHHHARDGIDAVLDLVGLDDDIARGHEILAVSHGLAVHGYRVRPLVPVIETMRPRPLLTELVEILPYRLAPVEHRDILILDAQLLLADAHGIHLGGGRVSFYESFSLEHIEKFTLCCESDKTNFLSWSIFPNRRPSKAVSECDAGTCVWLQSMGSVADTDLWPHGERPSFPV